MSAPLILLERAAPLATLVDLIDRLAHPAVVASGRCVLLRGEAGIGKTSLLQALQDARGETVRWWWGRCSAWLAPAPLGPLRGLTGPVPPALTAVLDDAAAPQRVLPVLLDLLRERTRPTVLVIEDAHWADGATLDLLRYLGRRIDATASLLVVSYRDDALGEAHPLQGLLGALPADCTTRLPLRPLSRAGVEAWARRAGHDPGDAWRLSGGNPFYLSELLRGGGRLPAEAQQAVVERAAALPARARELLDLVSIAPDRLGLDLLARLLPGADAALRTGVDAGLLHVDDDGADFRHGLVRQALVAALPEARRRELHARVLAALDGTEVSAARLVHHAEHAALSDAVCRWAPQAVAEAARAGAHRQVALLLGLLRAHAPLAPPATRVAWIEAQSQACLLSNAHDEAIDLRQAARRVCEEQGDTPGLARQLTWLGRLHWLRSGDPRQALPWVERAVEVLAGLPPSLELARAHATRSHLHLVDDDHAAALHWGRFALAAVGEDGDPATWSQAANNVGTALARSGDWDEGCRLLARSLAVAQLHELHEDVVRAHLNLFIVHACERSLPAALDWADRGVAISEQQGLDLWTVRLRVRRAWVRMMAGRWQDADTDLRLVRERHSPSPMEAATAGYVAAVLAVRRGEPGARRRLVRAVDVLRGHRVELWFGPTALALAEAAWLDGDADGVAAALAARPGSPGPPPDGWTAGEALAWRRRAGLPAGTCDELPAPLAAELAGRHREAAAAWEALGCPWQQAWALLGGPVEVAAEALPLLEVLGAQAALRLARRVLRERGARSVARGPYGHARADPLLLTARQRRILDLLCEGLSNREMAARLCRSERTVEGHVAALLARLGVRGRAEAVALAAATTFGGQPAARVRRPTSRRH